MGVNAFNFYNDWLSSYLQKNPFPHKVDFVRKLDEVLQLADERENTVRTYYFPVQQ
jgi:hypothetical protein